MWPYAIVQQIDEKFSVTGIGTVVSGTVFAGRINIGEPPAPAPHSQQPPKEAPSTAPGQPPHLMMHRRGPHHVFLCSVGETLMLGPDTLGGWQEVEFKGIHNKREAVENAKAGQSCS